MKRILLSCDPGVDDALAICLALAAKRKMETEAIVSTFGNVHLAQTKRNLLRILSFFDKTPVIGSGSSAPLAGKAPHARHVHGKDGLADSAPMTAANKKAVFRNGIDLIIELALSKKIDTIVATGPLTDLARAIKKKPSAFRDLKEIIIMGGAVFVKGNITPYSEFNFHCDPEAAAIVLDADVPKRLVSLDVTQKTLLNCSHLEPLVEIKNPLAKFIRGLADYAIWSNIRRGLGGGAMHDPLAVGLAIDEDISKYRSLCLGVKTKGRQKGMVVIKKGRPNVRFCREVDTERFFKLFIGALVKLAKDYEKERR